MSALLTPVELGLPAKFSSWRPGQWEAVETAVATDKRFIACSIPTGGGKSLFNVAAATLIGGRAEYVTSSKGLQDQLSTDFHECGLTDMRGRQNYHCVKGNVSCSEGRVLECRDSRCPYNCARENFLDADLCSTNYAYHLSAMMHAEGVSRKQQSENKRPDPNVICFDEAHAAIQELSSAVEIRLSHNLNRVVYSELGCTPPYGKKLAEWRTWAKWLHPKAAVKLSDMKKGGYWKHLGLLDMFVSNLARVAAAQDSWILDESVPGDTILSPLWPTDSAHLLWGDAPHIILSSATLVPKTLQLLNITEEESIFVSQDNAFDPRRAPVYLFGDFNVDHRMTEDEWQATVARMDTIIDKRLDRKGMIHPVSYANSKRIMKDSKHAGIIIAPQSAQEFAAAVKQYRDADAPCILMSPAATTGYDFAYQECEYTIILKMPFIDTRSPIMKARCEQDPEYSAYLTAQTVVQTCGRGMRAPDDQNECVSPDTMVLTEDLRWVRADSCKVGDRLLSFDEESNGTYDPRKWKVSTVEKAETRIMNRVAVHHSDGISICTPNHPWLIRSGHNSMAIWKRADELKPGAKLFKATDTWESPDSRDAGWLSGIYDGEGCLVLNQGKRNPNVVTVILSQNDGVVLDEVGRLLTEFGFDYYLMKKKGLANRQIRIRGGFSEVLRFLGTIRPHRLLKKFVESRRCERLRAKECPLVDHIECLDDGMITSLQTSARTFIADGFAVHNTFILDKHARWFLNKQQPSGSKWRGGYRHLVPPWFVKQLVYADRLPAPPAPLIKRKAA